MASMTVFLSDLHIGTNLETNWYQQEVHERIIKSVLDFVVQNGEEIKDLVILGDWFELWNYPPEATIPSLKEIFRRQPGLFDRTKDQRNFIDAMEAITGSLRYINGDHDMQVSLIQINELLSSKTDKRVFPGHGNDLEKHALANTYYQKNGVWAEHGNQHDLFCRPSLSSQNRCQPLPVGYFVNRLLCHFVDKQISSLHRKNASCISWCTKNEDSEIGFGIDDFIDEITVNMINGRPACAAKIILDRLISRNRSSLLEFNLKTEGQGFVDCFTVEGFYPGLLEAENIKDFLRGVEVACGGLGSFVRKHFCHNPSTRVILMGHTHHAEFEICGSEDLRIYSNTGYLCPSMADLENNRQKPTFVVVTELEGNAIEVQQKIVDYKTGEIKDGPGYRV
ncbi:MAG: hypothetical protein AB1403_14555 [Candidatus Riflebacteria bacterium]